MAFTARVASSRKNAHQIFCFFLPFTLEAPKKISPNEVPKLVITHKNVHLVHFSLFYQLSRDRLQILLLLLRESK